MNIRNALLLCPVLLFQFLDFAEGVYIYILIVTVTYGVVPGTRVLELLVMLLPMSIRVSTLYASSLGFQTMYLVSDALVPLAFILTVANARSMRPKSSIKGAAIPFLMVALVSGLVATDLRAYFAELYRLACAAMVFFIIMSRSKSIQDIDQVVRAFFLGGIVSLAIGLASHWNVFQLSSDLGGDTANIDSFIDLQSGLVRFNGVGGWFLQGVFALMVLIGLGAQTKILSPVTYLMLLPTLLSFRRTAWLAVAFSFMTYLLVFRRQWAKKALILGFLFVVFLLINPLDAVFLEDFRLRLLSALPINVEESHTFFNRFGYFVGAFQMFLDYPLMGVGLNQFAVRFYDYVPRAFEFAGVTFVTSIEYGSNANSTFLQILATTGLFGLAGFLYFVFTTLVHTKRTGLLQSPFGKYGRAAFTVTILMLVFGIAEDPLGNRNFLFIYAACLGASVVEYNIANKLTHNRMGS